jgi:hypothetical protein
VSLLYRFVSRLSSSFFSEGYDKLVRGERHGYCYELATPPAEVRIRGRDLRREGKSYSSRASLQRSSM